MVDAYWYIGAVKGGVEEFDASSATHESKLPAVVGEWRRHVAARGTTNRSGSEMEMDCIVFP